MSILKTLRERTELLNVSEVAKLLSVTEATVQRWVRKRQIPSIRIGDTIRFDSSWLADWIELQDACCRPPRSAGDLRWEDLGELDPDYKLDKEDQTMS